MSQWVWPESKADQSNVNVWRHMTCAKVIFDACHFPNIYYLLFYTFHRNEVGVKICCIVIVVLWLVLQYCLRNSWAIIFTFSLTCKGGGIVMACSSLTKSNFTSEQSLSFPLSVACSVLMLGGMNKFSALSLYCPLFTQRWRLSCAKAFTERLPDLQFFVNR